MYGCSQLRSYSNHSQVTGCTIIDVFNFKSKWCVSHQDANLASNSLAIWLECATCPCNKQTLCKCHTRRQEPRPHKEFTTAHGPRLYVCQAPNAFICVSGLAPKHQMRLYVPNAFVCVSGLAPKHQMRFHVCHQMRLYVPNAFTCVSPNVSVEPNGARFARLPLLASLTRFLKIQTRILVWKVFLSSSWFLSKYSFLSKHWFLSKYWCKP